MSSFAQRMKVVRSVVIMLLICSGYESLAQYSLGLSAGYAGLNAPAWEHLVSEFNLAHPERIDAHPYFRHGYALGADFRYERLGNFSLGAMYQFSNVGSTSENFGTELRLRSAIHGLGLVASWYPMGKAGERQAAPWLSTHGVVDWFWLSAFEFDRENNLPALALRFQDHRIGLSGGLSAGLDIRVDKNIFIAPFASWSVSSLASMPDFDRYLFGSRGVYSSENIQLQRFIVGVRIHMTGTRGEKSTRKSSADSSL